MPEKSQKILKKFPWVQKASKISIKTQEYSNKSFYWLENAGNFPKKSPKIPH
jgi:hypothetical protein